MKKVLLGTSAIALAGAFAAPADAAEWTVRVGGYMEQYIAYSDSNLDSTSGDFDGIENKEDSEIHFAPSITLDNGLKIAAQIELEGRTGGDQIDHTFMTISGSFGTLQLGEKDMPPYVMAYTAPDVTFLNINSGSDTKFWGGSILTQYTTTLPQVVADPQHIAYYSPRMAGFQIGAGYARDGLRATTQAQQDKDVDVDTLYDVWGVGANYVNSFGDFNVAVSGGYTRGEEENPAGSDHARAWGAGLNLGYGGFTIGGSYKNYRDDGDGVESPDNNTWDAGVSYETGPWGFSFTYLRFDGKDGSDLEIDKFLLGMNYALAKGVNLNAFGVYAEGEDDGEFDGKDKGWIVGTGIKINF